MVADAMMDKELFAEMIQELIYVLEGEDTRSGVKSRLDQNQARIDDPSIYPGIDPIIFEMEED